MLVGGRPLTDSGLSMNDRRVALTWTYEAATRTIRTYTDGKETAVCAGSFTSSPSEMPAPTDMWIGKSAYVWDAYLTAKLRDFKIFSKTLA